MIDWETVSLSELGGFVASELKKSYLLEGPASLSTPTTATCQVIWISFLIMT